VLSLINYHRNGSFLLVMILLLSACSDSSRKNASVVQPMFQDVTKNAGLIYSVDDDPTQGHAEQGGIGVDDINNDGYLDFFVAQGAGAAGRLFLNNKDGTFSDISLPSGVVTPGSARGAIFFDIDSDGLNDLLVPVGPLDGNLVIFKNKGDGTFLDVTEETTLKPNGDTHSLAVGDYDKDGDLDVLVSMYARRPVSGEYESWLWRNDNGVFFDITDELPIPPQTNDAAEFQPFDDWQWTYATSFSDVDNDGFLDLINIANYQNTHIYINLGGNGFLLMEQNKFTDEAGMGVAIGDYDNDGDLDLFISSIWHPDKSYDPFATGNSGNRLYQNNGKGSFTDVTDKAGVRIGHFGWGACFADFDNDGDLDLFHENGYGDKITPVGIAYAYFINDPAVFFLNNGDGTFTEMAFDVGIKHTGQGRGVACLDYNNDGYVDILIANNKAPPVLYKNTTPKRNNYLHVKLKGLPGNLQGVGAKVWITADGKKQLREIYLGGNYLSNHPVIAYFGVADASLVEKVEVEWNDISNTKTVLTNVMVNQLLTIKHPQR
jgi:enediyne biosynthesis protein E4